MARGTANKPARTTPAERARRLTLAEACERYRTAPWRALSTQGSLLGLSYPPGTPPFARHLARIRAMLEAAEADHRAETVRTRQDATAVLFNAAEAAR